MTERPPTRPAAWLGLGALAVALGHLRWGVDALAWVAPILWLRGLRGIAARPTARGRWRGISCFVAAWMLAWVVAVLKITSAPIPHAFALLFALPVSVLLGWPYLLWFVLVRRGVTGPRASLAFAAAMAIGEWSLYALSPFGTWGMQANAALGDLALLQLAAFTGATGIGFVLHALAAAVEQRLAGGPWHTLVWTSAGVLVVHAGGAIRLAWLDEHPAPVASVAAIGTDADVAGLPLPDTETVERWNVALFEHTRAAARAGAQLVVWTEAATLVLPADEATWIERLGELARGERVAIVAGYVVPIETEPLLYENAYALIRPDGTLDHRYLKHRPVPGEPAVAGEAPVEVWASPETGRVSGAICYDYDFPGLARRHAHARVDLVALPSSDWRGIDPIHTEMARLRAIESGVSILRSTRFGLAAGIDPSGRIRGQLDAFGGGARILMVWLPTRGVWTLYGWAGEWFVDLCAALLGLVIAATLREWRSSRSPVGPSWPRASV